jgi:four helix bundle suffix protein
LRNCCWIFRIFCGRRAWPFQISDFKFEIQGPSPEIAANTAICVIHQANYLLDRQLRTLEKEFVKEGSFTERLYRVRSQARDWSKNK